MSSGRSCAPCFPLKNRKSGAQHTIIDVFESAILWILRTGAPWRDLPERYGPHGTVSSRFYRWQQAGIWQGILQALQQQGDADGSIDWEKHSVDSTIIRAHQHAAGAKGGIKIKRH
jgi:transposase